MTRLLNNWPQKLLALTLAIVAWFSIDQNTRSTSQRELTVPVTVEGRASDQTETGAPDTVNIVVSGETSQVNRLRAENFDAILDLSASEGEYEQAIEVVPPQGIRLLSTEPDTAIGVVESIRSKSVPVETSVLGTPPENVVLEAVSDPAEVMVRGRSSTLGRITRAVALVNISEEDVNVTLYAVDGDNIPVTEVVLEPSEVTVSLDTEPVLYTRTLPLEVSEPEAAEGLALNDFSLSKPTLRIAGPQATLESIESVSALVIPSLAAPTTQDLDAGEYTLEVAPRLPEGVFSLERVRASFNLVLIDPEPAAPDEVETDNETEDEDSEDDAQNTPNQLNSEDETSGDDNDSTSAPVRRPGSAQDSGSGNNF